MKESCVYTNYTLKLFRIFTYTDVLLRYEAASRCNLHPVDPDVSHHDGSSGLLCLCPFSSHALYTARAKAPGSSLKEKLPIFPQCAQCFAAFFRFLVVADQSGVYEKPCHWQDRIGFCVSSVCHTVYRCHFLCLNENMTISQRKEMPK